MSTTATVAVMEAAKYPIAKVGQPAPDFNLPSTKNIDTLAENVKLSDYKGKWLILLFYPLDFTFVCPTELINFSAGNGQFGAQTWRVVVQGFAVAGSSPFKLHRWLLGSANAGNMTVAAPASAVQGATGNIGLTFSGLSSATRYLGSVAYGGSVGMPSPTIVRVDTP